MKRGGGGEVNKSWNTVSIQSRELYRVMLFMQAHRVKCREENNGREQRWVYVQEWEVVSEHGLFPFWWLSAQSSRKSVNAQKLNGRCPKLCLYFYFIFYFFLLISVLACEVITAQKSNSFYLGHSPRVCHNKTPSWSEPVRYCSVSVRIPRPTSSTLQCNAIGPQCLLIIHAEDLEMKRWGCWILPRDVRH